MNRMALIFVVHCLAPVASWAGAHGVVHPDPAEQGRFCQSFKPHELCFELPNDGIARPEYASQSFFAIILKSMPRCTATEKERLEIQAQFPRYKVFAVKFQCDDDIEESINYTNVNAGIGFIAVHAGDTLAEAKRRLSAIKTTRRFPGANIRRMQARKTYT